MGVARAVFLGVLGNVWFWALGVAVTAAVTQFGRWRSMWGWPFAVVAALLTLASVGAIGAVVDYFVRRSRATRPARSERDETILSIVREFNGTIERIHQARELQVSRSAVAQVTRNDATTSHPGTVPVIIAPATGEAELTGHAPTVIVAPATEPPPSRAYDDETVEHLLELFNSVVDAYDKAVEQHDKANDALENVGIALQRDGADATRTDEVWRILEAHFGRTLKRASDWPGYGSPARHLPAKSMEKH